ncbi:hypothetical protein [Novosphingobium humi]|uniref:Uncharacterized protein n=1 Tax=Novosphingobium humi TaxID=2282397 RepID=A0ABY7U033_9SPHN|nr:hypothetical protein [Novosphingobium humi]WCT78901.1 hypothetical protein PQ457_08065 [Novosphingobium humi]
MNPVDEIFSGFGGPTAIAVATGIKVQTVCDWRAKGRKNIPSWRRSAVLRAANEARIVLSQSAIAYLEQEGAA